MSASKARVVLNLIRGEDVTTARDILSGTTREAADVIGKVLASAVANAVNNDGMLAEELYVSAAYADEGITMKRFSPRARGRAGKIFKRSTHITVIVVAHGRRAPRAHAQRPQRPGGRDPFAPRRLLAPPRRPDRERQQARSGRRGEGREPLPARPPSSKPLRRRRSPTRRPRPTTSTTTSTTGADVTSLDDTAVDEVSETEAAASEAEV